MGFSVVLVVAFLVLLGFVVLVGSVAVGVPAFVTAWALSRDVRGQSERVHEAIKRANRRVNLVIVGTVYAVVIGVVLAFDPLVAAGLTLLHVAGIPADAVNVGLATVGLLLGTAGSSVGGFFAGLVTVGLLLVIPGVVGKHVGLYLNYRTTPADIDPVRWITFAVVPYLLLLGGVVGGAAIAAVAGAELLALVPAAVVGVWLIASPALYRIAVDGRPPTPDEREPLASAYEAVDVPFDPGRVRVVDLGDGTVSYGIVGVRGRRWLFPSTAFFGAFDPEQRQALLQQFALAGAGWGREYRASLAAAVLGAWVLLAVHDFPGGGLLVTTAVAGVVWAAASVPVRLSTHRLDERLAGTVGRDTLVTAYERLAEHTLFRRSRWRRFLGMTPSYERRAQRLRDSAD